ncbi:hypothetical protein [Paraburkholderia tropica]|uniref:hypothetical protein n=1 Tax=Paraburkholderia tropica TaxID=92647 RepID=UPI003D2E91A3
MTRAEKLKGRVDRLVRLEIERCKTKLSPGDWTEHHAWIEEHIVASAHAWLLRTALEGRL